MQLSLESVRVLGSLMEKEMTTPENYPLSLNALVGAANQKSSREPVLSLSEDEVRAALDVLDAHGLTARTRDARVPRYEHRIRTVLNLRRDETAVLCLLLLRGPQTPGELRGRADRMFPFDDIAQVQSTLDRMAAREEPLATMLPRQPGSSANRWLHLLGDQAARTTAAQEMPVASEDHVAKLQKAIADLEIRVRALEDR